jgi:hypothetical protein
LTRAAFEYAMQGIKVHMEPATPTRKLGTSGGVGVMWGPGVHLIGLAVSIVSGRACGVTLDIPSLP